MRRSGHAQSRGPDQRAELIGRLDQYVHNTRPAAPQGLPQQLAMAGRRAPAQPNVPMPPALDRALADIAARQQMLNGGAPPRRRAAQGPAAYAPPHAQAHAQAYAQAPAAAPLPTQDLSGLEEQLRKITDQIETLRHPGVEEAINALRAELGEIGHALGEAMPQHSIETIERQIQGLSQRIAEGRQNGVDHGALSGIEHGLVEVRDALRGLTPAENLVGFNDAVAGLAQKIDLIVAQKDPETLAQLENAITTLRGMANHVASNDTVSALAAEVQALTDKVDHIAHAGANADALSSLEHRIDALGQALAERAQNGGAVPPRLEALVQSLSDKIEQIQAAQAHGGELAGGHLDDRIAMLVERLDASDSRLGQLEAIERGLADLLLHIEQSQGAGAHAAQAGGATAVDALKYDFAQAQESLKEALKHDLVHSQAEIKGDIARTQDALDQVHGTLGELVQRLATIEQSIRQRGARAGPSRIPRRAGARGIPRRRAVRAHPAGRQIGGARRRRRARHGGLRRHAAAVDPADSADGARARRGRGAARLAAAGAAIGGGLRDVARQGRGSSAASSSAAIPTAANRAATDAAAGRAGAQAHGGRARADQSRPAARPAARARLRAAAAARQSGGPHRRFGSRPRPRTALSRGARRRQVELHRRRPARRASRHAARAGTGCGAGS